MLVPHSGQYAKGELGAVAGGKCAGFRSQSYSGAGEDITAVSARQQTSNSFDESNESLDQDDAAYENYLADREYRTEIDREIRLEILEAASFVEDELIAVAVFYVGGGSIHKQTLVDELIFEWGGRVAAEKILRTALELHDEFGEEDRTALAAVKKLVELRNLVAHGRIDIWQANDPEEHEGQLGRKILRRSTKGKNTWVRINFDEARTTCSAGRDAAHRLSQHLADLTRRTQ